ncbi:MAG: ring-opening amidohydrolase [Mycobacteriaceae bacterium]|uniref:ring-opening amidohydrolase n=1 Tax=Corynebacterium sp. TaxID=1720 RepID=UPI003F98C284
MSREQSQPLVEMIVCPMTAPSDTSALERAVEDADFSPADVIALVAKSEGHGLPNDYGRVLCEQSLKSSLATLRGTDTDEVSASTSVIVSGGSPGVLSPHVTVIAQRWVPADPERPAEPEPDGGGLVLGRATTEPILPEHVGRRAQVETVSTAVAAAMSDAGVADPSDVHLVMVKGPALTPRTIDEALASGKSVVTTDPGIGPQGSMCFSNDASALGVAVALGEVPDSAVTDEVIRQDWSLFSSVAATSAGGEKKQGEVLLLANRADSLSPLRIGHSLITDLLDTDGVRRALANAGLDVGPQATGDERGRIAQVFAKVCIPASNELRGAPIVLNADHEAHHVAKALGAAIVGSVTGKTTAFVSGGEKNSHMGPPGANPVAAVVRR